MFLYCNELKRMKKQSQSFILQNPPSENAVGRIPYDEENKNVVESLKTTNIISYMESATNTVRIPFVNSHKILQFQFNTVLPKSGVHCFHDHHPFVGVPIPIPYACHPSIDTITATNQDIHYFIHNEDIERPPMIEVIGYACSFQCNYAYLQEHHPDGIPILKYMYFQSLKRDESKDESFIHCRVPDLHPAPSWKLLKAYGGHLSIEEFRHSFYTFLYTEHDFNVCFPTCIQVGHLFERKAIF